jgi:hypothetical protein
MSSAMLVCACVAAAQALEQRARSIDDVEGVVNELVVTDTSAKE